MTTIVDPVLGTFRFTYDETDRRTDLQYPNGITTSYEYDNGHRMTAMVSKNAAGTVLDAWSYQIAARLHDAQRVTWRANAPWELPAGAAETTPEIAATAMADLWQRDGQVDGALNANGAEFRISAITEGEGGQLSLQCTDGVFGRRYDDLAGMLQRYTIERHIRVSAPLQQFTFGA